MSLCHSPKIVTDGLVLYLDAANSKSFKGEPTTNLIPSPAANGRFTTSNYWGTINTTQYNSNTYFSIGTVSNITDNIVTLSPATRTLNMFDCLRPQTTGGGVTAGVQYFIKPISSTQFTIHTYNGSQNGSQGYIDPSTGMHKVHESIALDQRVSINSSGFPTMWWGAPHQPNQCHVKEIVEGGGYVKDTNCMRIHVTRTTNVDGGMAYSVYTPVTEGDLITVSFYVKTYGVGIGTTCSYSSYFGPGKSSYSFSYNPTEEWTRIVRQWTASATYNFYQYFYFPASSTTYHVDMADLQVEVNKTNATPFVAGTRGTTVATGGGLADLSNNGNHGELVNNPTYDSSNLGSLVFNGSNQYLDLGLDNLISDGVNGWTAEYWFKTFSASTIQHFNSAEADDFNANWLAIYNSKLAIWNVSPGYWKYGSTILQNNIWYQAVFVCEPGGIYYKYYINGKPEGGDHVSNTWTTTYRALKIRYVGRYEYSGSYSRYFVGQIPLVKAYNKALSQQEITQNFNAIRGRFGI